MCAKCILSLCVLRLLCLCVFVAQIIVSCPAVFSLASSGLRALLFTRGPGSQFSLLPDGPGFHNPPTLETAPVKSMLSYPHEPDDRMWAPPQPGAHFFVSFHRSNIVPHIWRYLSVRGGCPLPRRPCDFCSAETDESVELSRKPTPLLQHPNCSPQALGARSAPFIDFCVFFRTKHPTLPNSFVFVATRRLKLRLAKT